MLKQSAPIPGYQGTPPSVNWDHPPRFEVGPPSPGYQGNYYLGVNLCFCLCIQVLQTFSTRLLGYFFGFLFFLAKTMNPKRIGEPFVSNPDVAQRKRFKETFRAQQLQGRIKKETVRGKSKEFLYTNFVNEVAVGTALVGDSIVDNICLNGCSTFSLSGGVVNDFYGLLPTMKCYGKIILSLGGNNLSRYNEPGEAPESVLAQIKDLVDAFDKLENQPRVVVCTVLRRTRANHFYINTLNRILVNSQLSVFNLHRQVYKNRNFLEDGIHLTLRGSKTYACGIKKLRKEKFDDDDSFRN